uniref:Cytochrome P450 n=1 Tax=Gossypium raimondii TaxID=29730 RepID=A0A0D2TFA7_GOSRA|nr:hypothetical protein B456_009G071700 [Gossypium raimondii]
MALLHSYFLSAGECVSGSMVLAVAMSIASYFLIPMVFGGRHKNWKNAPPGPVGWPILGSLPHLSNRLHEDFFHMAKIYGPLFSLNLGIKPAIVVSSPEMAAQVLKEKEGMFSSRTITETIRVISYDAHSIIFSPYGPRWKVLRRILITELLSPKAFEQFEPLRTSQVHGLLKYLYLVSKSNTQVNIAEYAFTALANLVSNFVCSKDLFDNSMPEGRKMKERFWELIKEMFIAGTETTSSTVEWGMAEILRKPSVLKKLLLELDQVVGKDRFVVESDIPKLAYLQAVVKEVFRLHPGVPLIIPRRTNEACEVAGYHIPKHCIVYVNVWGMARDPNVWEDPLEFKPERFIGSSVDVKGQDFNLLPFGTGRRSCVGWPLAHRMVHYYLAALLHAFQWESPPDVLNDLGERVGLTIQKGKSLLSTPKPRLPASVYER